MHLLRYGYEDSPSCMLLVYLVIDFGLFFHGELKIPQHRFTLPISFRQTYL
jgi:hypothetical protein